MQCKIILDLASPPRKSQCVQSNMRITAAHGSPASAHAVQADALGREIMAQLKAAAGDEAYLQALVQAKQHATAMRRLRRKQQASEVSSVQC